MLILCETILRTTMLKPKPLFYVSAGLLALTACSTKVETPNFIIINMDDMGFGDPGFQGGKGYQTPNMDRMASQGVRFTYCYSAQAVSGASRMGLLTGCYPNRLGYYGAPGPKSTMGINAEETTMAEVLKANGYATACYGKWHLGCLPEHLPLQHGFDEYCGIPYSNDMSPLHVNKIYHHPLPLYDGNTVMVENPDQRIFTTLFTERAVHFIEKNKKQPFFIYLAHPMPHVPLAVSDKFAGKSRQGAYGDVMMELDWSVGQILAKLEEEGLSDNTLVILTADNGPWLNYGNHAGTTAGLREGKGTSFEGGQRVVCAMQWKGVIEAGSICEKMISHLDFLPTFAALSGAALPERKIDGVDISPLIFGDTQASPRKSFYYYYRHNNLECVSDGTYKMVFPHKGRTYEGFLPGMDGRAGRVNDNREITDTLLFNLRRDPGERYNLMGSLPAIQESLLQLAAEAIDELGDDLSGKPQGKGSRFPES